jgi:mono/diheme cytochrome c family protein
MRHLLANIATYTIATLLVIGAALFAWLRSSQITFAHEATLVERFAPGPREFRWEELGRMSYQRNCLNCHGPAGEGWAEYPPLVAVAALYDLPGGRENLIDLHLHGRSSDRFGAPMPRMAHLSDVEIAAVLNYILTVFGGFAPETRYLPEDVAARRAMGNLQHRRASSLLRRLPRYETFR